MNRRGSVSAALIAKRLQADDFTDGAYQASEVTRRGRYSRGIDKQRGHVVLGATRDRLADEARPVYHRIRDSIEAPI
jgi:hypothetical protein